LFSRSFDVDVDPEQRLVALQLGGRSSRERKLVPVGFEPDALHFIDFRMQVRIVSAVYLLKIKNN
jgi:hypothetical protein